MKTKIMAAFTASVLTGCSSTIEGAREQIKVVTYPGGADCALNRRGQVVGRIGGTPGFTTVEKTRYDITIRCNKAGYKEAIYLIHGGAAGVFFDKTVQREDVEGANDSASNAVNEYRAAYDVVVNLTLCPIGPPTPARVSMPAPAQPPGMVSHSPNSGGRAQREGSCELLAQSHKSALQ